MNAIRLNCGHIFCYLCIKGVAETTGVCALCRAEIDIEFNYRSHEILGAARLPSSRDGYYWFYEGYQGWWLYDADTTREIEQAYQRGDAYIEKLVAGSVYTIDLQNMIQQRKDGEGRKRKICREKLSLNNILGLSGLRGEDFQAILGMMRSA